MKNPWGEVTGIRPVKIARTMLRSGKTKDEFVEMFKNHLNVSDEKTQLTLNIAVKEMDILKDFNKVLTYLDNSHIDKVCGDIALKVIRNGVYYGYLMDNQDRVIIQELPVNYCRSRFFKEGIPTVEFNMRFFDD